MRKECLQCLLQFGARKHVGVTLKHRISAAGMGAEIVASFPLMKRKCWFLQSCNILSCRDLPSGHNVAPCFSAGCPVGNWLVMVIKIGMLAHPPPNLSWTHERFISHSCYMPAQVTDPDPQKFAQQLFPASTLGGHLSPLLWMLWPELVIRFLSDYQKPGKCRLLCV